MSFRYNDKVEIIRGFYEGLSGRVVSESRFFCVRSYLVQLERETVEWFYPWQLRKS